MCTRNKDNEWYIYLRNKDTMSQSLPQPGGMTPVTYLSYYLKCVMSSLKEKSVIYSQYLDRKVVVEHFFRRLGWPG